MADTERETATVDGIKLELLRSIQDQLKEYGKELKAVSATVIRLEERSHGEDVAKLQNTVQTLNDRIIVLETNGKVFAGGVSFAVAVIVSIISAVVSFMIKTA